MARLTDLAQKSSETGLQFAWMKAAHDHIAAFLNDPLFNPNNVTAIRAVYTYLLSTCFSPFCLLPPSHRLEAYGEAENWGPKPNPMNGVCLEAKLGAFAGGGRIGV